MRVAVVGSGGREHALAWKIAESPLVQTVWCLPGNAGTALEPRVTNLPWRPTKANSGAAAIAELEPDLVVIGPEAPLVDGLADRLRQLGIPVVGPGSLGAQLEASKAYAKRLMQRASVPTARAVVCHTIEAATAAIESFGDASPVIKADGLAAGKGVTVAETRREALAAAREALVEERFGSAGRTVLVEERVRGVEASFIVLTDGRRCIPLPTTQDHKRLLDGDRGPNTGGMGAILPNPFVTPELEARILTDVIHPVLAALSEDGTDYRGFLYAGLMLTDEGPRVLEFNVRSGDPETQPIMYGLLDDLVPVLTAVANREVPLDVELSARPTASVVVAAPGYPIKPDVGSPIHGLVELRDRSDVRVFHAGTALVDDRILTSGGRVLAVTARDDNLGVAIERAYAAVDTIEIEGGMQVRRDIGRSARGGG